MEKLDIRGIVIDTLINVRQSRVGQAGFSILQGSQDYLVLDLSVAVF